jgi:hypothetical protein
MNVMMINDDAKIDSKNGLLVNEEKMVRVSTNESLGRQKMVRTKVLSFTCKARPFGRHLHVLENDSKSCRI